MVKVKPKKKNATPIVAVFTHDELYALYSGTAAG